MATNKYKHIKFEEHPAQDKTWAMKFIDGIETIDFEHFYNGNIYPETSVGIKGFFEEAECEIPKVPSTVFYIVNVSCDSHGEYDKETHYFWVVPNTEVEEQRKAYNVFALKHGAQIVKTEIKDQIIEAIDHGVHRDDLVAMIDEIIVEHIMKE